MPPPSSPTSPAEPGRRGAPPRRRRVRLSAVVGVLAGLLLLLVVAAPLVLLTALRTEVGTAWLLRHLPDLTIEAPRGALLGGDFAADRVTWLLPGPGDLLVLDDPAWQGLSITRSPDPGTWLALRFTRLQATRATYTPAPRPAAPPSAAPTTLRLPVALQVDALALGEFRTPALGTAPVREVRARLQFGADAGAQHRIDGLQLVWDRIAVDGSLRLGSDAPVPVDVMLKLQPAASAAGSASMPPATPAAAGRAATPPSAAAGLPDDWRAELRLSGPLARPALRAGVRRGEAGGAPLLEADATLLPFAAWPLADLQARTRDLDLSAFASGAPRTALSGQATVRATAMDRAAEADIGLDNSAAGPWNEGRLPVRALQLRVQARPDRPQVATIERFEAELGAAARPAGRLRGRGSIDGDRWTLDATLDGMAPQHLDARASPMRLSGTLALTGMTTAPPTPAGAGSAAAGVAAAGDTVLTARGGLSGRLEDAPAVRPGRKTAGSSRRAVAAVRPEVRLAFDAIARLGAEGALKIEVKEAVGRAGGAVATVRGQVDRAREGAPWLIQARSTMTDFDPRPWWSGADDSPWRRGPHRLNGSLVADLQWRPEAAPAAARTRPADTDPGAAAQALLAPWRGQAALDLRPSVLAGVALQGRAELQARGAERAPVDAQARVQLVAAGNRLDASLASRADRPADDRWQVAVDAPALAALAPAAALLGIAGPAAGPPRAGGSALPVAGRLVGQASATGRWPAVRTEGRLAAQDLRAGGLALRRGDLRWQLGTRSDAPADLSATVTGLSVAGTTADTASLRLEGTARQHRLSLSVDSQAVPPAWAAAGASPTGANGAAPAASAAPIPVAGPSPTRAELRAEGGFVYASATSGTLGATGWRGQVQTLTARSGQTAAAALGLRTGDVAVDAAWAAGAAARVTVQPGRLELQAGPTTAALRWSRLAWQAPPAGAGASRIDAEATLEPLAVAPILARLQPAFGWGGDLQVGGTLSLQSAPRLRADIVLERRRGDLSVTDEIGTQTLGLSDLRLGLNADNGVWSFTQALAGSTVGVAAGAVVARTGSDTAWPTAATPIQGVLELQVANLGAWGPWVPAGWRLGGTLRTSATLGGRLGAPEYTGELRGRSLTVRNFAEGVNVTDGEVGIVLQGLTARIDTFTAKAGTGTLRLTGGASFGSAPKADVTLRAERFQLLGRVDRRIVASGEGQLQLDPTRLAFDGRFSVDEGLIDFTRGDAPSLSDDVVVIRPPKGSAQATAVVQREAAQKAGAAASRLGSEAAVAREAGATTAATKPPPTRAVALNLLVNLGQQLRLRGRGLDTGLRGELRITSPGGRLSVNGTVSTQGGTYQAYGQKLSIDRGSITFNGLVDNPRLDIEATRPNTDVRVGVTVGGTATNPRIRLFSEPDLPEVDKLSWLVLGRATDGLGRTDTALLQRAALALLSGEGPGVTDRITKALGLDEVSLRQTDGEVRETVISLGKQLSQRWYVGYERGLNATAGSWQLIYRIAQRLTLRAQSGLENSIDVIWTWRWQ